MKVWNEEQIVNLARRAYESRVKNYGNFTPEKAAFIDGTCAVFREVLNISWAEAERRLLKGTENLKEPKG